MMGTPCAVGDGGMGVLGNGPESGFGVVAEADDADVGVEGVVPGVNGPCALVGVVGMVRAGGAPEGEG